MKREDNISNISFDVYCEYPNPHQPDLTISEYKHCNTEERALNLIEEFKKCHPNAVRLCYLYSYTRSGMVDFI